MALVALVAWTWPLSPVSAGKRVLIHAPSGPSSVVDLSEPVVVEVAGRLGVTRVAVGDGMARVVSSPCANRLCIRMGAARRPGDVIVCVPNGVVIAVEGVEKSAAVDAVAQ